MKLIVIFALILTGCAHAYKISTPESVYEKKIEAQLADTPMYSQSEDYLKPLSECVQLKAQKRSECVKDRLSVGMAKVNLLYPDLSENIVMDVYLANRDKLLEERHQNDKSVTKEDALLYQDAIDAGYNLYSYEIFARRSHQYNKSKRLHQESVARTNAYNQAVMEESSAWADVGNNLNQIRVDNNIKNLQRQQNELQWQQKTGGKGIRPYNQ